MKSGLGLDEGLGRQLGGDCPVLVVESQEAPVVLRADEAGEELSGELGPRTGEVGQLTRGCTLEPGRTTRGRSRGWPHRPAPGPCQKRDVQPSTATRRARGCPGPCRPRGRRSGRWAVENPKRSVGPRLERGRPLVAKGLARRSVLAQADHDESGLGRSLISAKSSGQTRRQLLVRLGRDRADQVGTDGVSESRRHRGEERSSPPGGTAKESGAVNPNQKLSLRARTGHR